MIKSTTLSICHSSLVIVRKLKVKSSLLKLCNVLCVRINLSVDFKKKRIALISPDVQFLPDIRQNCQLHSVESIRWACWSGWIQRSGPKQVQVSTVCILELKLARPKNRWFLSSQCHLIRERSDMYMRSHMSKSTPSHIQTAKDGCREEGGIFLP